MREILFRGQTRRFGEKIKNFAGDPMPSNWVYGGVCQGTGDFSIIYGSMDMKLEAPTEKHVIYTDTIGQFTGLTDKNGTKIFEGDIVKHTRTLWGKDNSDIGVILWCENICKFYRTSKFDTMDKVEIWKDTALDYEIIGNIHDNKLEDFENGC
jgi:hypothetical protein